MRDYFSLPPPYMENGYTAIDTKSVAESEQEERMCFVRKVYSILSAQLLLTVLVSSIMYLVLPIKMFFINHSTPILVVTFIVNLVCLGFLVVYRRTFPANLGILSLFTLSLSFVVGLVVVLTDLSVILKAAFTTLLVFFGLTLFTLQSKWDFSGMAPFLFGGLTILLGTSIIAIFLPYSSGLQLGLGIASSIIFSGYIIFDTYMIFNRTSCQDYVLASVDLYLDIINLFMAMVNILTDRDD